MTTATLTSKGQLTLPIEMRTKLRLQAGSKVEFVEGADGSWRVEVKNGDIKNLKGVLNYHGPIVSLEEMDAAIGAMANQDHKKSLP